MKYYTGIGARDTPKTIQDIMVKVAENLSDNDWILRSGGAKGSDQAFEFGCDNVNGDKEIYLPWPKFENSKSNLIVSDDNAFNIAEEYHPYWHNLSQGARKLQARNSHQVLGGDLNTLSNIVLCYTKDGKGKGGTGQAIRIAKAYDIPIFDFGKYDELNILKKEYVKFIKHNIQ